MPYKFITIIVPIYNLEQFLPRCINSLLNQLYRNFEIILVDDGSTDGSGALCDEFVSAYPTIVRCIHKANGGPSSARNAGLNVARGDFVIFSDSDDWVEPDYLEQLIGLQAQYHTDLVCTGHFVDFDTKCVPENPNQLLRIMSGKEAQAALLISPCMSGYVWNKLFRLDIIRENNLKFLDDVGTTEDLDFSFRYLRFCDSACFDPSKRTYHYCQRSGSATRSAFSPKKLQAIRTYEKILRVEEEDSPITQAAREEICNTAINLLVMYLNTGTQDAATYQMIRNYIKQYYSVYLKSKRYGVGRKVQAVLAHYTPRLYGIIKSIIMRVRGKEMPPAEGGGMEKMYRVLHVAAIGDGGIAMVILNWYNHIDREKIHFDIASTTFEPGNMAAQLQDLGANIYFIPRKADGIKAYKSALEEILIKGNYDAIHVHESETSYVANYIARRLGIKKRVAHSHFCIMSNSLRSRLSRLSGYLLNYHYATDIVGCGVLSGEQCFGKYNMKKPRAHVLKNGIDLENFRFNLETRNKVRAELGLKNKFVIGMVGRLVAQKNYPFAFDIVDRIKDTLPQCVLLVAGDGPQKDEITGYVKEHNLEKYVTFLGARTDVNFLYMAMDAFMLTSRYEGFPIVGVEATASGLPVLLSDSITKELDSYHNVQYLPLQDIYSWVDALVEIYKSGDAKEREKAADYMKENGFDTTDVAKELEEIYLSDG